jgi:hypothetical protein
MIEAVDAEGNVWSRRRIERQLKRHYYAKLSLSKYFQSTLMTKACLSENQSKTILEDTYSSSRN